MKKFFMVLAVVVLSATLFAGCKSSVVLNYADAGDRYIYLLEIRFAKDELTMLNASAAAKHSDYHLDDYAGFTTNWTVDQYLRTLMSRRTGFSPAGFEQNDELAVYAFIMEIPKIVDTEDSEDEESDEDYKFDVESNLFMHKVTVEDTNPLAGYRAEYDAAAISGRMNTAIDVIQNGLSGFSNFYSPEEKENLLNQGYVETSNPNRLEIKYMPSFAEAFPIVKGHPTFDPSKLSLEYILQTSARLLTSGTVKHSLSGDKAYSWQILFDGKEYKIVYQYYRPNTIGWNILAIFCGVLTVGGLFLYCRYKANKKPKKATGIAAARDLFPYDPFAEDETNPYKR